ncbi:hypothetical protein [Flavobacterium ovatum]|uniref:hypothetical protein n=1 Tax=Flavobacterium ovatum TaxID=1928857 RepID=UPI00344DB004
MKKIISIFLLVFVSWSCSSNLDFNQTNDLILTPIEVLNLTYFDVPASQFVTSGGETKTAFATLKFDAFNDSFFRDNLVRTDFFFEVTNTINRAYIVDFIFYNETNQPIYTISFNIPASNGTPQVITKTEIFKDANLDLLKQAKKEGIGVEMLPGTPLTENSPGNLKLRSSANVYMEIK